MPPRGSRVCHHSVRVELEQRTFIVEYDTPGHVARIKQIKKSPRSEWEVSWWTANSHPLGTGDTLPKRVIAAALAKTTAQDRNADATP